MRSLHFGRDDRESRNSLCCLFWTEDIVIDHYRRILTQMVKAENLKKILQRSYRPVDIS